ncbi:MAG TPA: TIGR03773 family transporter-associated surface protein [Solirubrobacteraceae bacterium]|nr:TIGR03773 family transporter-associated surface protein [Solirubrobacteraceae bacterium]
MRRLLATAAALLALGAAPAAAGQRTVIADGHVDLGPRFAGGTWTIQIRDDTVEPPTWRELPDVVLQAVGAARTEVPDDRAFAFLGKPGAPVWLLPQVEQTGVLWPGWNTQHESVVDEIAREVTWRLHGVRGPGRFALFSTQDFGAPALLFSSARPFPQEIGIDADSHVHANWAFSAPGTYLLDVELAATTRSAGDVNARETLRIFVGDNRPERAFEVAAATPPSTADDGGRAWPIVALAGVLVLAVGGGVIVARRRRREPEPSR